MIVQFKYVEFYKFVKCCEEMDEFILINFIDRDKLLILLNINMYMLLFIVLC